MKINKPAWYGIDHDYVINNFEGELSFVNEFCVLGEYQPSAVYRAAKPNKTKGHKKYMLITKDPQQGFVVRGMSAQKIQQYRYQNALHCLNCDEVIYSINQHNFRRCTCGKCFIDGGNQYMRIGYTDSNIYKLVTLDMLTDTVSDSKNSQGGQRNANSKSSSTTKRNNAKTKHRRRTP